MQSNINDVRFLKEVLKYLKSNDPKKILYLISDIYNCNNLSAISILFNDKTFIQHYKNELEIIRKYYRNTDDTCTLKNIELLKALIKISQNRELFDRTIKNLDELQEIKISRIYVQPNENRLNDISFQIYPDLDFQKPLCTFKVYSDGKLTNIKSYYDIKSGAQINNKFKPIYENSNYYLLVENYYDNNNVISRSYKYLYLYDLLKLDTSLIPSKEELEELQFPNEFMDMLCKSDIKQEKILRNHYRIKK